MERKTLNPYIWDRNKKLYEPIRKKLLEISEDFLDGILLKSKIENIFLTGSICSYQWTEESDIDIHIIAKPEDESEFSADYFDTKSKLYNKEHNIYIKGFKVELNIKFKEVFLKGKAVYDLKSNKWIKSPIHSEYTLTDMDVLTKVKKYQNIIDDAIETQSSMNELKKIRDEIKALRVDGLKKDGEYSIENLTFKKLRHTGYIKKLYDYKAKIKDKSLSLESFYKYFNL
jgi:predicted nucleotidyltransferase